MVRLTRAHSTGANAAGAPLVSLRGVVKTYGAGATSVAALRGISFDIDPGDFVALVGPSGSGKSTCLNILGCLDVPSAGVCLIDGHDTARLDVDGRARLRRDCIGFVFQGFHLIETATALRNVELPLVYRGVPAAERRRRALAVLDQVGLADRAGHRPNQLSGGQQQRVAIARALVGRPRLLIADEPTGALDTLTGAGILKLMSGLNHDLGVTVVLVTHDGTVARQARRRIVMSDGAITAIEPAGPVSDAA